MPSGLATTAADHARALLGELDGLRARLLAQLEPLAAGLDAPGALQGLAVSWGEVHGILTAPFLAGGRASPAVRLDLLARRLDLTAIDIQLLLLSLLPEVDLRYERVFGFLNDDATRRRPSVELALALAVGSVEERLQARRALTADGSLVRHGLVTFVEEPYQKEPPRFGHGLRGAERVLDFLLGADSLDGRLAEVARLERGAGTTPIGLEGELARGLRVLAEADPAPLLLIEGEDTGAGRALGRALAAHQGQALLVLEAGRLVARGEAEAEAALAAACREARLLDALLLVAGAEALLAPAPAADRSTLVERLLAEDRAICLASRAPLALPTAAASRPCVTLACGLPDVRARLAQWQASLGDGANGLDLTALASRFRVTRSDIAAAAQLARCHARTQGATAEGPSLRQLEAACRRCSAGPLQDLAQKIEPRFGLSDIVLPPSREQQLRELIEAAGVAPLVLDGWGFGSKLVRGSGLTALFSGPSGTGKTMAAEIVAGELGLDLYRIDLSAVVSKYIGETEKNLERIFKGAAAVDAVLFFDEADALFGRRSEVKDAHDRYANIETGFLLQRLEVHDGIAILASNLSRNMDEAFVRRLQFAIEFPFPGERERRRIWSKVFPEAVPLGADLDLDFLARRFELAGGNIRNVALGAALMAAAAGEPVGRAHTLRAVQREYQKLGRMVLDGEFAERHRAGLKGAGA